MNSSASKWGVGGKEKEKKAGKSNFTKFLLQSDVLVETEYEKETKMILVELS